MKLPEILAPGGDALAVKAAILAGAGAVYLGLEGFNARRKAANISEKELPELISLARSRGVKVYITANILLTEEEIPAYLSFVERCAGAGADGFIIQDLGALELLSRERPDLELHASTQLTTHSSGQIAFLGLFGVKRVNLARELPAPVIRELTYFAHGIGIETEVFVHGAYCISYSGQCFMSSFMGGESGNRGVCFQPCRRYYDVPGREKEITLLSLKDNNALAAAELLVSTGTDSLKIEGRIKNYQYVYTLVSAWKDRLDRLVKGEKPRDEYPETGRVFNRGFSAGYLLGRVGPEMFAETPFDQALTPAGRVSAYRADTGILDFNGNPAGLKIGQRIFICTEENLQICAALVVDVPDPLKARIRIENELKGRIIPGLFIFSEAERENTPGLKEKLSALRVPRIPLRGYISGKEGKPLKLILEGGKLKGEAESSLPLVPGRNAPLTQDSLMAQVSRLGDTPYELESLDISGLQEGLFMPVKEINSLRRAAVACFGTFSADTDSEKGLLKGESIQADLKSRCSRAANPGAAKAPGAEQINPAVLTYAGSPRPGKRSLKERETRLACLISDPEEASLFPGAVILMEVADPAGYPSGKGFIPWLPAVIREEDLPVYDELLRLEPDIPAVINNSALAVICAGIRRPWIAGPYLSCANSWAFSAVRSWCASGGFFSLELSKNQILSVFSSGLPKDFSLWTLAAGEVLLMTTRQCLFSRTGKCEKDMCDPECYTSCHKTLTFSDKNGNSFYCIKNPWNYTRIFNNSRLWVPEMAKDLKGRADYLVADFRTLPFRSIDSDFKIEAARYLRAILSGEEGLREPVMPFPVTRGNYRRGLS